MGIGALLICLLAAAAYQQAPLRKDVLEARASVTSKSARVPPFHPHPLSHTRTPRPHSMPLNPSPSSRPLHPPPHQERNREETERITLTQQPEATEVDSEGHTSRK